MNNKYIIFRCGIALKIAISIAAGITIATASTSIAFAQTAANQVPTKVAIVQGPTARDSVVSWSANVTAAVGYRVERRVLGTTSWAQAAYVLEPARSAPDDNLTVKTTYEYQVIAFTRGGAPAGYRSATVRYTTPGGISSAPTNSAADRAASAPRQVDAQAISASAILVTWKDASSDETGFKIERRDNGGAWRSLATAPANATLYRDSNAVNAQSNYDYRITATRASGDALSDIATAVTPSATMPSIFFVDPVKGNDSNSGANESAPWKTLQKAADSVSAGQTILARAGTYLSDKWNYANANIENKNGRPDAWITFRNYPGESPLLQSQRPSANVNGNNHGIIVLNSSYIVIDGFEVKGHLNDVTYDEANKENIAFKNNTIGYASALTDSSGITVKSSVGSGATTAHHVVIRNNTVHDHPGGGINSLASDYVIMENNRVYNVASYSPYGASGLNFYQSVDYDKNTSSYRQIARNNIVSNARNLFPCSCVSFRQQTDGNGIILYQLKQRGYTGKTLITGNVVYNNGARGIHLFQSQNADVFSNTTVRNSTIKITGEGEITSVQSKNIRVYNNIMIGGQVNNGTDPSYTSPNYLIVFKDAGAKNADAASVDFNYNIIYGGADQTISYNKDPQPKSVNGSLGANNRVGVNPLLNALDTASVNAYLQFALQQASPAIDTANAAAPAPAKDAFGAPRPRGKAADIGAIESY